MTTRAARQRKYAHLRVWLDGHPAQIVGFPFSKAQIITLLPVRHNRHLYRECSWDEVALVVETGEGKFVGGQEKRKKSEHWWWPW